MEPEAPPAPAQQRRPRKAPFRPGDTTRVPPHEDIITYRIVVGILGAVAIIATVGGILLAFFKLEIPQLLLALGSAAVGALASPLKR